MMVRTGKLIGLNVGILDMSLRHDHEDSLGGVV